MANKKQPATKTVTKNVTRTKHRTGKIRAERHKTAIAFVVGAMAVAALGLLANPSLVPGKHVRLHALPPSMMTLGTVGLACYTLFFLLSEVVLLILAAINIRDDDVHNRYKDLMLLVVYVFTFRYRRVLPGRFFPEDHFDPITNPAPQADKPQKPGKHRG